MKPTADIEAPRGFKPLKQALSDEDFWGKPPEGPKTWEEDADLVDDPRFKEPALTTDHIHIHIHKG